MPEGYITELVLYDSVLFDIGRNVDRWAASVQRNYKANARLTAPINKRQRKSHLTSLPVGSLMQSIESDRDRIGPKHIQITVSVNVPYAEHVIYGTGTVFPQTAKRLRLPYNAGFTPLYVSVGHESRYTFVRGQSPNNFLERAHMLTAAQHSSLRGLEHQLFQQH